MAKTRKFHQGMFVTIPKNIQNTDMTCGASETMRDMSGQRKTIDKVHDSGRLSIGGFIWDPKDFSPSSPPKKIPITHFDPEELVI